MGVGRLQRWLATANGMSLSPLHCSSRICIALSFRQRWGRLPNNEYMNSSVGLRANATRLAQSGYDRLLRRQRRSGDSANRLPAIAMSGCAAQRGAGMPANPDWRVRLLRREGFAADVGVSVEAAIEAGGRLGPELL